MSKKYKDKSWLKEKYLEEGKTVYEVASLVNCNSSTIGRYLHKFDIPIQYNCGSAKARNKYRDGDWLREQYLEKEKGQKEIAAEIGVVQSTIGVWLQKYNIKTRKGGPDVNKFLANELINNFLIGSLLGDGSLVSRSKRAARYSLGQKYKGYCQWISNFLSKFGIEQSGQITSRSRGFDSSYPETTVFNYKTLDYANFKQVCKKWYPNTQKIIPNNIQLSPIALRHWFIEDGGLNKRSWGVHEVRFATNGFDENNVERLAIKLAKVLNVSSDYINVYNNNGPYISFAQSDTVTKFFDYIAPLPEELEPIYGYKWSDNS